jgi:hypothetical protein
MMSKQVADLLLDSGLRFHEITYDLEHVRNRSRLLTPLSHLFKFVAWHPVPASFALARIVATRQMTQGYRAKISMMSLPSRSAVGQVIELFGHNPKELAHSAWLSATIRNIRLRDASPLAGSLHIGQAYTDPEQAAVRGYSLAPGAGP